MPEGDTIHRSAVALGRAITGSTLTRLDLARLPGGRPGSPAGRGPRPGTVVDEVEARGKYLLIHFGDGSVLETHMKMTGSWHLYRVGERWRRSRRTARVVLETGDWVAVCFAAPHVELRPGHGGGRRGGPDHLGPDLCGPRPDFDEVVARIERLAPSTAPLADVLLDQRVFCGVGNVFKSEVAFACELHPMTPMAAVGQERRRTLVEVAHRQLRANLGGGPRATVRLPTGGGGLAVYGRAGQACVRCSTTIERAHLGRHSRVTFWCAACQGLEVV